MQSISLKGTKRETLGKVSTKQLRNESKVPCVLYGGEEVTHFSVASINFEKLIFTPKVHLVDLDIDGKAIQAIIKDIQYHPVSDKPLHVDFLQISEDKPVTIEIPVKLNGLAEGVKAGGKLTLEQRKLKVKGLSKNLPDNLDIEISKLALGKTIQVGALSYENLELLNAKNSVVVAVKLTRAARAAQQAEK